MWYIKLQYECQAVEIKAMGATKFKCNKDGHLLMDHLNSAKGISYLISNSAFFLSPFSSGTIASICWIGIGSDLISIPSVRLFY